MKKWFTLILISLFVSVIGQAAIPTNNRQIGGQAGAGFSLLRVKKVSSQKKGIERLVFYVGTKEGYLLKGLPGYFNAQNKGTEIVIDFAQMPKSKLSEKAIKEILKDSFLIQSSKMTQDPIDHSLTLRLVLNRQVKMKVIQVKGNKETARIVMDFSAK